MKQNVIHYLYKEKMIQTKEIDTGKKDEITIKCINAESANAAVNVLDKKLSHLFKIEQEKPKNPIIKIVGIDNIINIDEKHFEYEINNRNFLQLQEKGRVLHTYTNNKNKTISVIMEVTAQMHKQIKENNNKLFVVHQSCTVFDVINVKPCFKCGRVGHNSEKCRNKIVCLKCAGAHMTSKCTGDKPNKCTNCCYSNSTHGTSYDINHFAIDSIKCEILKTKINKFINSTKYEFVPKVPRYLGKIDNNIKKPSHRSNESDDISLSPDLHTETIHEESRFLSLSTESLSSRSRLDST